MLRLKGLESSLLSVDLSVTILKIFFYLLETTIGVLDNTGLLWCTSTFRFHCEVDYGGWHCFTPSLRPQLKFPRSMHVTQQTIPKSSPLDHDRGGLW